jgi:hypothetical protein
LREIEKFAVKHELKLFYVDGKRVAKLSEKLKKPTISELVSCIVD